METVTDFIFLCCKIMVTVIADMKLKDICYLKGKLWQTYSVLKSSDVTLLTKVCIVKAIAFPVVMYACESWTKRKADD